MAEDELAERIAEELVAMSRHLHQFTGQVAKQRDLSAARARLLAAGVSEAVVAQSFTALRILLADPGSTAAERLGLGAGCSCTFCGHVPRQEHLVSGRDGALCRSCALLMATRTVEPCQISDTACCMCSTSAGPGSEFFRATNSHQVVCADCVDLTLSIMSDPGSGA